ncbi:MAG TPA: IclR family transcriptional regulator [Thermodesulfobacteriota bacterium]
MQRAFAILEAVGRRGTGMTMSEIGRETSLHPSTAFHLVRSLVTLGYLRQVDGSRRYRLGSKVFQLASSVLTEVELSERALPFVTDIARASGETSHLAVLDGDEVVVIAKVDGQSPLRLAERVGYPRPLHCTAIGKVLLAHRREADRRAFLAEALLEARTARTITSRERLEAEIEAVRARGYAVDDEEFAQGLRCVAMPVRNFTGQVVAAIGLSGPVWRVSPERMPRLVELVGDAAARLSAELGYRPPQADPPAA